LATYPDIIGKHNLARDPADANHPRRVPCGLLPTTFISEKKGKGEERERDEKMG
jgi:hypothetical protein